MTRLGPPNDESPDNFNNVGLDGYWERRARAEGARIIVGQRLELGNTFGWGGGVDHNGDYIGGNSSDGFLSDNTMEEEPLMPWDHCEADGNTNTGGRCGEARQRRTLRDNLAAVQSAAVYHSSATGVDKDFPVACLASVTHPGTAYTLQNSSTFLDWTLGLEGFWDSADVPEWFISDFFRGEGTNGWEYETPSGGSPTTFASDLADTKPLGKALRNLAYFAGDPYAGAPSFKPVQDQELVHPYPLLSMWGDFSVLRRIFQNELDAGISYANLSPADKTTLQTAACSLGMLANEVYSLEKFKYANDISAPVGKYGAGSPKLLDVLNSRLLALELDRDDYSTSDYDSEVLSRLGESALPDYWVEPPTQQNNSSVFKYYKGTTTFKEGDSKEGFDGLGNADPEAYIARLQQWKDADQIAIDKGNLTTFNVDDDLINLAKIIMLREQTIRDRSWGFLKPLDDVDLQLSPNCMPTGTGTNPLFDSEAYGLPTNKLRKDATTGLKHLCTGQPKFGALYSIFPGDDIVFSDDQINSDDNHGEEEGKSRGLLATDKR